jgi:SAM-dependent methyltransferase
MALNQFNCTTMDQLALLLDVLKLKPGLDVLDAGCGTGRITKYLAAGTGADFVGIDLLPGVIERARQLAAEGPGRLEFKVSDMEAPGFPPASFDAVISIESLYPTRDHIKTIATFKNILRPGGQIGLFHTYFSETPGLGLGPDDTLLAKALQANRLNYEAHDLTEADRRFWKRSHEIAEEMRSEFAVEGNSGLLIDGERDAILGLINQNRHARYLYHVVVAS